MMRPFSSLLVATFVTGCAAAPLAPAVPTAQSSDLAAASRDGSADHDAVAKLVAAELATEETEPAADEPVAASGRELPTQCAAGSDVCTPPANFAKRLCKSTDPNVALALFRKSSPWTRAYVRQDMEAWYASARRSRPRQLRYAEEVIVIADRAQQGNNSGFQVSGMGSYDVVRWDGSCVSLMEGELSFRAPSTPDVAPIPWKHLHDDITDVLEKNQKIAYRNDKRRKECKKLGEAAIARCEKAELGLSRMIAEYVRGGGDFPLPLRVR